MILFIPIQGWAMNFVKRIQAKQMELKDRRLKAITEMLNGMKVLKVTFFDNNTTKMCFFVINV